MSHQLRASLYLPPRKNNWFVGAIKSAIRMVWDCGKRIFAQPTISSQVNTLSDYSNIDLSIFNRSELPRQILSERQNAFSPKPIPSPLTVKTSPVDIEPIQASKIPSAPSKQEIKKVAPRPKRKIPQAPRIELKIQPEILNRSMLTFMDNPLILGNAFQLVANQQNGRIIQKIEGIETDVNKILSVGLSTKQIPQGLGVGITQEGAMLIWHRNADLNEINRIKLQLQKMYLAIAMIHSLQDNLGYDIIAVHEGENIVIITGEKNKREITILLDATTGDIVSDFSHFKKMTCFEESEKLMEALLVKGVSYQPMGSIPKDDDGVLLFDMAIGEITIDDHSSENDRHMVLEAFRKLGIQANIQFDSPCG